MKQINSLKQSWLIHVGVFDFFLWITDVASPPNISSRYRMKRSQHCCIVQQPNGEINCNREHTHVHDPPQDLSKGVLRKSTHILMLYYTIFTLLTYLKADLVGFPVRKQH